jgi:hypothetical protein
MNAGQGSLAGSPRNRPPSAGPPFVATAANNGTSVDPVTGKIVLGNDIGGTAAQLLNAREIDFNNFSLQFIDTAAPGLPGTTLFANGYFQVTKDFPSSNGFFGSSTDTSGDFQINSDLSIPGATPPRLALATQIPADLIYLQNDATGFGVVDSSGLFHFLSLDKNTQLYQLGDVDGMGNGCRLFINDPTQAALLNNMSLQTGSPSGLVVPASWELGSVVAAAAVLDATQYVEVSVNGVLVKLAIIQ